MAIQIITAPKSGLILEESIRKRVRAALSIPATHGWQSHKCELGVGSVVGESVEVRVCEHGGSTGLPPFKPGVTLGVSFRVGQRKCMFSSKVRAVIAKGRVLCISLAWPEQVESLQRRAYNRVAPPGGQVVAIRFWRELPGENSTATRSDHFHGQLENLSAGGMCVSAAEAIEMVIGHAYRCVFTPEPGSPAAVVTAMLRHREPSAPGRVSLGLQFVGLEAYPEGRSQLHQLVNITSQYKVTNCRRRG